MLKYCQRMRQIEEGLVMKEIKTGGKMVTAVVIIVLLGMVIFLGISQAEASPATIYVPDDYTTIQGAVNAASAGDTIIVRDGTYTENVDVNKDHLTIKSDNGAEVTIVQTSGPDDDIFEVTADYITIDGFAIKEASRGRAGIYLGNVNHCNIYHNTLSDNEYAIRLVSSSANSISNNVISGNRLWGISLQSSNNNIF